MPERIQLSRRKGWRKPENTVVVARPSRWGNPFRIVTTSCSLGGMCWTVLDITGEPVQEHAAPESSARAYAVQWFAREVAQASQLYPTVAEIRTELAGKNLACWCPLDQPCHADVLLEIANGAGDG